MEMTSIDMESTYLSRTGRQPSNEEVRRAESMPFLELVLVAWM